MAHYYVNKNSQPTGEHEIHKSDCSYLPDIDNRVYLGSFDKCTDAVKEAKKHFDNVDGCYYCSIECHKK
ncbi:MAG TPA: hypothetical protein VLN45_02115 [Ignavibacteriaceae bacterium]|nr:hypothetical protein [Ignavibacteriaceae bacterium]